MTEDKRRKDKFLNNGEKKYFQHSDSKLNSRFPHQILFSKIRLFVSKQVKHETTNMMKMKKKVNPRAETSTAKAKGKINLT